MGKSKRVAVILAVTILFSVLALSASAQANTQIPLSSGIDALKTQFLPGVTSETDGYTLDYRYYSPVKGEGDTTKYPLVIWLHGLSEGSTEGKQIEKNNIAYWTSKEFQERFSPAKGAFIFAPRSLEENANFWGPSLIAPLKAAIDEFAGKNASNIDLSRIYIGGFSMGGKMTMKMIETYPEMFAAAFPICPFLPANESDISKTSDIPIWLVSGKNDPLVNYCLVITPTWKAIQKNSNVVEDCRFSLLENVCYPDGSKTSSSHHSWFSVTYDMFSIENGDYPNMTTVDGLGNQITLTYPNGMISWLSQFTSNYSLDANDSEPIVDENDSSLNDNVTDENPQGNLTQGDDNTSTQIADGDVPLADSSSAEVSSNDLVNTGESAPIALISASALSVIAITTLTIVSKKKEK